MNCQSTNLTVKSALESIDAKSRVFIFDTISPLDFRNAKFYKATAEAFLTNSVFSNLLECPLLSFKMSEGTIVTSSNAICTSTLHDRLVSMFNSLAAM